MSGKPKHEFLKQARKGLRRTDYRTGPTFTSPLEVAISNGDARIGKRLIEAGANFK